MLFEIGLQLQFCFIRVQQKLLPRPERQSADIAKRNARRGSYESDYFETPVRHAYIMARCRHRVKCAEARGRGVVAGRLYFVRPPSVFNWSLAPACAAASRAVNTRNGEQAT